MIKVTDIDDGVELIYMGVDLVRVRSYDRGAFKLKHAIDTYRFFAKDKFLDVETKVLVVRE